jgi:hypothetical protein
MALIAICCPKCGHRGFAASLPRTLCCFVCAHTALFRVGECVIRGDSDPEPEPRPKRPQKRVLIPGELRAERRRQKAANVAAA